MAVKKGAAKERTVKESDRDALDSSTKIRVEFYVDDERAAVLFPDRKDDDSSKGPFSSGAVGWNESGKISIAGYNHQLSLNLVQVGTKQQ